MEWAGGCFCGGIRYRSRAEPEWVGHCHCSMCWKWSGAGFSTMAVFPRETFEWTKGKPTSYRSSERVTRSFCPSCGSSIAWETHYGRQFAVMVGSLDRPQDVQLECHVWTSTWLPWVKLADNLPDLGDLSWEEGAGPDDDTRNKIERTSK